MNASRQPGTFAFCLLHILLVLLWRECTADDTPSPRQVPNERISNLNETEFRDKFRDAFRSQARKLEVTQIGRGIYLYRINPSKDNEFLLHQEVQRRSHEQDTRKILYSEPNYVIRLRSQASPVGAAPGDSSQYGLSAIWARNVWKRDIRGSEVIVAIVDSGIDIQHQALKSNLWHSTATFQVEDMTPSVTCTKPTGFDAITPSCSTTDVTDGNGHGTHVAGIIAANGAVVSGGKLWGVAPKATLLAVKAFDQTGSGQTASVVRAYTFLLQLVTKLHVPIRIVNNSWGFQGATENSQALHDLLNDMAVSRILSVSAADDAGRDQDSPGSDPYYLGIFNSKTMIGVSATGEGDTVGAAWGLTTVDLRAPGFDVWSTLPGNSAGFMGGTSMSTAFVSGAAALLLTACRHLGPEELKLALTGSVDVIDEFSQPTRSHGRLNVLRAIDSSRCQP